MLDTPHKAGFLKLLKKCSLSELKIRLPSSRCNYLLFKLYVRRCNFIIFVFLIFSEFHPANMQNMLKTNGFERVCEFVLWTSETFSISHEGAFMYSCNANTYSSKT